MIDLIQIRVLVDRQDGNLAELEDEARKSSSGVSAALEQCIATHRHILEVLNAQTISTN